MERTEDTFTPMLFSKIQFQVDSKTEQKILHEIYPI